MGLIRRQFVFASALIAAAMILGGASARAGYVSVPAVAEYEGGSSLVQSQLVEFEASSGMGDSTTATQPHRDADGSKAPSGPVSPLTKLLHPACNFGHSTGAGSSSTSAPGTGPSTSPAGDLPRQQVPPLELSSLLPPQTGDAHPFSVVSFLFRPPRAA